MNENETFNIFYLLLLLGFVGSSVIIRYRNKMGMAAKHAGIWLLIVIGLIIAYSYRHGFNDAQQRLIGELFPSRAISNNDGSVSFRISDGGHFFITAKINGYDVNFMLDTGASDIVLTRRDAEKIGINPARLQFTKIYNTANGTGKGAPVTLDSLRIGNIIMNDIPASVNDAPMDKSLLGMSFLKELDGYEVKDEVLTLWP